jgi:hypothetical protein
MQDCDCNKAATFNGQFLQPKHQIPIKAKGFRDPRHHEFTFVVIPGLPYDVVFGRKTIHDLKFATPNPNSEICRENYIEFSGMQNPSLTKKILG